MRRVPASTIRDSLWIAAVALRVVAVLVLVLGPWTDEAAELAGWDAERFQEIADRTEDGWADQPIEYPPGSVIVFDVLAGDDVVSTNRTVVLASALVELALVVLLWRSAGPRAAKAFVILGLPLVPMGLLRLDMLVTALATAAALALVAPQATSRWRNGDTGSNVVFAVLVMAGAMIKIWPALLVAAAVAIGRRGPALAAVAATGVAGVIWLAVVGAGLEPVDQVFSLRGASGWHVESLPGAIVSLAGDAEPRLELNAFRIGTINRAVVTGGRAVAVVAIIALAIATIGHRSPAAATRRVALVMLGAVAALLVTAPLLSPQFLLWLTPWGALLLADERAPMEPADHPRSASTTPPAGRPSDGDWPVIGLLAMSLILTGAVLAIFGPANVAGTVPAALLTARNLALVLLPVVCYRRLRSLDRDLDVAEGRAEHALWHRGTGPHP